MINPTNTKSIIYWKYCTKKALDLLQKQALNRRTFLIKQHKERIETVQYLLNQRQEIEILINEKQFLSKENEVLTENLRNEQNNHLQTQQLYNDLILNEKQCRQKLFKLEKTSQEQNHDAQDEIDLLKNQLKTVQQQFERLTTEHLKFIEQADHDKCQYQEHEQQFQDEIQRLKRDLGLELYRKQDAEKKSRLLEDKLRHEQTQYQRVQYDFTKTNHELQTLEAKYNALQLQLNEIESNQKSISNSVIDMFDAKTSTTTVNQEESTNEPKKRQVRPKRRTNDENENENEKELKKPKRLTRNRSTVSTDTTSTFTQQTNEIEKTKNFKRSTRDKSLTNTTKDISTPIKQTRKKPQENKTNSKVKAKTGATRGRPKKRTIESPPKPIPQESNSPIYATIQRDVSLDRASFATVTVNSTMEQKAPSNDNVHITPKTSTFKRIQSFFRVTPTLTSSARINRVAQVKNTVVAFGSSTPTNRLPPSIVKTPGPNSQQTSNGSVAQKVTTPKSKYNLRTRLFNHQTSKDEDEKKSQTKKLVRTRK